MEALKEQVHQLIQDRKTKGWSCQVCQQSTYSGNCPAIQRYSWFDAPEKPGSHLTKKQLDQLGLKPGGPPRGFIYWKRKRLLYLLYERSEARAKRAATPKQLAALAKAREVVDRKRRTCPYCNQVRPYHIPWSRNYGLACYECQQTNEDRFHEENRRKAQVWARTVLARNPLFLDLETTGFNQPGIVQIGLLAADGSVLLDTLINPERTIEPGAEAVHGITAEMVAEAPAFAAVADRLHELIRGRIVVAYNVSFDVGVLHHVLCRQQMGDGPDWTQAEAARKQAEAWLAAAEWHDAMEPWSTIVGDWSDYYGGYRWQPLPGGNHTALGDCRAVLAILQDMAREE